jgi:outer membrane protein assembly factor BamB
MEVTGIDADIVWLVDLRTAVGMYPHDSAHASLLMDGDYLYLNSCNGVDNSHVRIRAPDAPSLIVLDKHTGQVVAEDAERIGPRIFHSTWSSPAMGEVAGRRLVFFCGGDGVVYAFDALPPQSDVRRPRTLERVWRFDCDPTAPKENVHQYHRNRRVSPSNIKSMPVFVAGRLYVTVGGDIWWGKHEAWLKCIDTTQSGEITETGEIWSYELARHCCATPAVFDGLVFVGDCRGQVHCVDARTGKPYWVHRMRREVWGSSLVADGKVYVGSRAGDFAILAAGREKRVLAETQFDGSIASTPVAANGVLYVATLKRLYAIDQPD